MNNLGGLIEATQVFNLIFDPDPRAYGTFPVDMYVEPESVKEALKRSVGTQNFLDPTYLIVNQNNNETFVDENDPQNIKEAMVNTRTRKNTILIMILFLTSSQKEYLGILKT